MQLVGAWEDAFAPGDRTIAGATSVIRRPVYLLFSLSGV